MGGLGGVGSLLGLRGLGGSRVLPGLAGSDAHRAGLGLAAFGTFGRRSNPEPWEMKRDAETLNPKP